MQMNKRFVHKLNRCKTRLLLAAGWMAVAVPYAVGQESAASTIPDWQKAAGGKMEFEVASVRLNPGPHVPPNFRLSPDEAYTATGGLLMADYPLANYVDFAYKIWPTREQEQAIYEHLPKWVQTDEYEVHARAAGKNPTKDQMRLMMQALLKERFALVVHYETQETLVLEMTLMKPGTLGPKLHRHEDGPACDVREAPAAGAELKDTDIFPPQCGSVEAKFRPNQMILMGSRDTTMELIAESFSIGRLGRQVVDATGLTGKYDFTLKWTPDSDSFRQENQSTPPDAPTADPQGATFLGAVKEQLGLKLKPGKAPLKMLVIDHVERPSEN
jgi:uncharacterized protein (TIGR03435 family)